MGGEEKAVALSENDGDVAFLKDVGGRPGDGMGKDHRAVLHVDGEFSGSDGVQRDVGVEDVVRAALDGGG